MKTINVIEGIGTILGIVACSMLNIYSTNPNMLVILSLYSISALLLAACSYARRTLWITVLMSFYALMGFYGIFNLLR
jgi:hypothetical protein